MRKLIFSAAVIGLVSFNADAQTGPRPLELGIDAGVTIALGDNSFTTVSIPAQSFRIGFPISPRVSLEPKFGINVISGDGDTFTTYRGELGLLYHLGSSRYPGAYQRAGLYVRPFIGIVGFADGNSDSAGLLGAGVGYKFPIISRLSSRFEANFEHEFGEGDSNAIGLLAGLSFFTR